MGWVYFYNNIISVKKLFKIWLYIFWIWMVNFIIEEMNNAIVSKIYYEIL